MIWPRLFEKQRAEIFAATVLEVDGVVDTDGGVHHLIARGCMTSAIWLKD